MENLQLHFILLPLMSRSRIIPFVDLAKILSERGFKVTIAMPSSTAKIFHQNLKLFYPTISTLILNLPCKEAGLPQGCDSIDLLPCPQLYPSFFSASAMVQNQLETYIEESEPKPNAMLSDVCLPWTEQVAEKFGIPRVIFHVNSCFTLVSSKNTHMESLKLGNRKKMKGLWCVGPVSSCGLRADGSEEHEIFKWLDSKLEPVIYVCFGSLRRFSKEQMVEIGLGLEASGFTFIWVIGKGAHQWLEEEGFQERLMQRGFLLKGWAPQVRILNHCSVKGFVTNCGWNSTLEGVSAGVPMVTWPTLAEQFLNESFIVNVLKIGVAIRDEGRDRKGDLVSKEEICLALDKLMEGDCQGNERRKKINQLSYAAKKSVTSGSSLAQISSLIQHFVK